MKPIYDITAFTMLDYVDHTACVVWFAGCNFRCPYCHNPDIVTCGKGSKTVDEVFDFLKTRVGKLEAVVLSGGECTLYPDIVDFARKVKAMGFKVKMDTNGTRPKTVKTMVEESLVDFIALDYKAPEAKFYEVTKSHRFNDFAETLRYLCSKEAQMKSNGQLSNAKLFEVRTTVHTDLLNEEDVDTIREDLDKNGYCNTYYVQNFMNREEGTLGDLPEQRTELNTSSITETPKKVKVKLRNF